MLEPKQNIKIKNFTYHNLSGERQVYGLVVRMMPGNEYVIVDIGDTLDIRVHVEDVELVE